MKALVTGSGGLIGSACVGLLADEGWQTIGIDNNMREHFFGREGSTLQVVQQLCETVEGYQHHKIDIRDREAIRTLIKEVRPDLIVHTAAQPSHDKAASIPYEDFDTNATGTLNLLVAAHDFCRESPFCFTSTNKVYGDRPNYLPIRELATRYDYEDGREGINENMSIDQSLHSLFGASKLAADILCQEFGRYYDMPVGVFRAGCLTGSQHAAVELHGFLGYIVYRAVTSKEYTIFGYKGKQVRDQLHSRDIASLFLHFFNSPRCGEVYNVGGGRPNSMSVLETISALKNMGWPLNYSVEPTNRIGDHICYISDLSKVKSHFPDWQIRYDLPGILEEMVERHARRTFKCFAGDPPPSHCKR